MKTSVRKGFSFGLTSGIITTLGLMIGLYASTESRLVVIGGILAIAIADAFSDALGIHISEESKNHHSRKEIWESTFSTFLSKFFFALTFILPILVFGLFEAIAVSAAWGLLLLAVISFRIAKRENKKPFDVIFEHMTIAILVVIITYFVGYFVRIYFGG